MFESLLAIDKFIFLIINTYCSNTVFDFFFITITEAKFWIIPAIIAAVFFIKHEKRKAVVILGLAVITVAISDPVSSQILKPLFGRHRPCHPEFFIQGGNFLAGMKTSLSFPSSHAMNMFAQATLFSCFYPSKSPVFFGFALLIGISRIYVGVHYPSDIVGGAFFGIIIAYSIYSIFYFFNRKIEIVKKKQIEDPACKTNQ